MSKHNFTPRPKAKKVPAINPKSMHKALIIAQCVIGVPVMISLFFDGAIPRSITGMLLFVAYATHLVSLKISRFAPALYFRGSWAKHE